MHLPKSVQILGHLLGNIWAYMNAPSIDALTAGGKGKVDSYVHVITFGFLLAAKLLAVASKPYSN